MLEYPSRPSNLSLRYILRNIELSSEQLAKLCGVSRRQLSYWIDKGFVPPPDQDPLPTLEKAALIKVRLDQGDNLRQALQTVAEYYADYERRMRRLEEMPEQERSEQLVKALGELQVQVGKLRQVLSEPSPESLDFPTLLFALRSLALGELNAMLPHSTPTPELILRLQQSAGFLHLVACGRIRAAPQELWGP